MNMNPDPESPKPETPEEEYARLQQEMRAMADYRVRKARADWHLKKYYGPLNVEKSEPDSELPALKHGMCAKTRVLSHESPAEYDAVHARWHREYGNPPEGCVHFDLVRAVADAAWEKQRCQLRFDSVETFLDDKPIVCWTEEEHRSYALAERYRSAADRKFTREFKMLDSFYKAKLAKEERAEKRRRAEKETEKEEELTVDEERELALEDVRPSSPLVINLDTGEERSRDGQHHKPAPPDPSRIRPAQP